MEATQWTFLKLAFSWRSQHRLMPYLLGLFHWGACRVSNLGGGGQYRKTKTCKINRIAMPSLGLYERVPTAHSLRRNPPKLRRTEWALGTKRKTSHSMHFPHNPINFASFRFRYFPKLLTLHAPEWNSGVARIFLVGGTGGPWVFVWGH